tara:strand:- start:61 stop:273 length:213 start_codon:yes stop_codon:yes gene_type:complete
MIDKNYVNELLNSLITLTEKEILIVEDYLFDNSSYYYPPNYPVPTDVLSEKGVKTLASGAVSKPRRRCNG